MASSMALMSPTKPSTYCLLAAWFSLVGSPLKVSGPVIVPPVKRRYSPPPLPRQLVYGLLYVGSLQAAARVAVAHRFGGRVAALSVFVSSSQCAGRRPGSPPICIVPPPGNSDGIRCIQCQSVSPVERFHPCAALNGQSVYTVLLLHPYRVPHLLRPGQRAHLVPGSPSGPVRQQALPGPCGPCAHPPRPPDHLLAPGPLGPAGPAGPAPPSHRRALLRLVPGLGGNLARRLLRRGLSALQNPYFS